MQQGLLRVHFSRPPITAVTASVGGTLQGDIQLPRHDLQSRNLLSNEAVLLVDVDSFHSGHV